MVIATFDRKSGKLLTETVKSDPRDKPLSELITDYVNRMWRIAPGGKDNGKVNNE